MDKYEEALLRMRQHVESGIIDGTYAESIFPEFAESEDERIRREIIDFIQWAEDRGMTRHDYHQAKRPAAWITYLEKQKDSKWSPSEDEMGVLYKLCYISNQVTDEDDTNLTRLYQDLKREYFNGRSFENMFPSEKQKEQKPIESCDGICCGDDRFKTIGEARKDIIEKTNITENKLSMELPLLDGILTRVWQVGWLNKKQKPAWSEEDEKILNELLDHCNTENATWYNWLKSIRPQPQMLEDERIRKELINYFQCELELYSEEHSQAAEDIKKWLSWLEKQKDSPMPEDTVIFQKGVEEGRRLEREDLPYWQTFKGIGIIVPDDYILAKFGKGYKLLRPGDTIEIGTEFLQVSQLDNLPKEEQQKEQKPGDIEREWYNKGYLEGRKNAHIPARELGLPKKYDVFNEQKPAEKQDYSGLSDLERAIHRGFLVAGVENVPRTIIEETAKDCLAQQKQEWSKEEKRQLNRIYAILGQAADTHAYSTSCRLIGDKEAVELQDFLRSIASLKNRGNSQESNTNSPSWKPSVEQMSVFGRIVNDLKIKMVGVTIKEHHTLDLLYNDLKKLM